LQTAAYYGYPEFKENPYFCNFPEIGWFITLRPAEGREMLFYCVTLAFPGGISAWILFDRYEDFPRAENIPLVEK